MAQANLGNCAKLLTQLLATDAEKMLTMKQGTKAGSVKKPSAATVKKSVKQGVKSNRAIASKKMPNGVPAKGGKFAVRSTKVTGKSTKKYDSLLQSDAEDSLKTKSDGPASLNNTDAITKADAFSRYYHKERFVAPTQVHYTSAPAPGVSAAASDDVPFNKRLQSSTPNVTPTKNMKQKAVLLQQLLKDVLDEPEGTAVNMAAGEQTLTKELYRKQGVDSAPVKHMYVNGNPSDMQSSALMHQREMSQANRDDFYQNAINSQHANSQQHPMFSTDQSVAQTSNRPGHINSYSNAYMTSHGHSTTGPYGKFHDVNPQMLHRSNVPPAGISRLNLPRTVTNEWPSTYEEYVAMREKIDTESYMSSLPMTTGGITQGVTLNPLHYDLQHVPTKEDETVTGFSSSQPGTTHTNQKTINTQTNAAMQSTRPGCSSDAMAQTSTVKKDISTSMQTDGDRIAPRDINQDAPLEVDNLFRSSGHSSAGTQTEINKNDNNNPHTSSPRHVTIDPTIPTEFPTSEEKDLNKTPGNKKKKSTKKSKVTAQTVAHLLRELKAVPVAGQDREFLRLLTELETSFAALLPGVGSLNWQMELDLAMQPLRSENAQLRRKLRILNQQTKGKDAHLEDGENACFELLHQKMLNQTVENQLKEEKAAKERLQEQLKLAAYEVEKLTSAKADMLQLINNKDSDHLKSQQDWLEQMRCLRSEVSRREVECVTLKKQLEVAEQSRQKAEEESKLKAEHAERLSTLVRGLQFSLRDLLSSVGDGNSASPRQWGTAMDHLQHAMKMLDSESDQLDGTAGESEDSPSEEAMGRPTVTSHLMQDAVATRSTAKVQPHQSPPLVHGVTGGHVMGQQVAPGSESQYQPNNGQGGIPYQANEALDKNTALHGFFNQFSNQQDRDTKPSHGRLSREGKPPGSRLSGEYSMDSTQYLFPPGGVGSRQAPLKPVGEGERDLDDDTSGLTVKDFLGGLADRLRQHTLYDSGAVQTEAGLEPLSEHPLSSSDVTQSSSEEEKDSTLIEDAAQPSKIPASSHYSDLTHPPYAPSEANHSRYAPSEANQSRYSVTDYFKKYSGAAAVSSSAVSHHTNKWLSDISDSSCNVEQASWPAISVPDDSTLTHSQQEEMYRGTELDTSLSTIQDTATAVSSISTLSSFDDLAFEQGLASLDENIARIQASLKSASIRH